MFTLVLIVLNLNMVIGGGADYYGEFLLHQNQRFI